MKHDKRIDAKATIDRATKKAMELSMLLERLKDGSSQSRAKLTVVVRAAKLARRAAELFESMHFAGLRPGSPACEESLRTATRDARKLADALAAAAEAGNSDRNRRPTTRRVAPRGR